MGGRGSASVRNSGSTESTENASRKTGLNQWGFEIELGKSPEVEFSKLTWERMAQLRALGHFEDYDLRMLVDNKISDLVNQYGDLEAYDADLTNLRERIENEGVTDDEYWAAYHVMADTLGIRSPRYIAGENGNDYGYTDTRFGSMEEAADWGHSRDLTHVIDTWTGKYIKIGGKNWRSR